MKAAVYHDKYDIRYEEIPVPKIGSKEVLIKMEACGLCGTDIHKALHKTVKPPIVLGHEVSGVIVKKGKEVRDFEEGDRVFVAHHVPCFTCHFCLHDHHTLCRQFKETNIDPGGFAEYIRIPEENVKNTMHKIPEDLSFEEAAMAEPVACCIHGLKHANIMQGDSILIMGAGQIGLIHAQLARYYGADTVFVSDVSNYRLEISKEFGVDYAIDVNKEDIKDKIMQLTNGKGVDAIVIAAGVSSLLKDAVECVARGGRIIAFSPFDKQPEVTINSKRFFEDEISIIGSYSSMPYEYRPALNLIKKGVVNVKGMITHRFPISKLQKAIDIASNPREKVLKVILKP